MTKAELIAAMADFDDSDIVAMCATHPWGLGPPFEVKAVHAARVAPIGHDNLLCYAPADDDESAAALILS